MCLLSPLLGDAEYNSLTVARLRTVIQCIGKGFIQLRLSNVGKIKFFAFWSYYVWNATGPMAIIGTIYPIIADIVQCFIKFIINILKGIFSTFSKNEVKFKYDKKCHNAQKFLKSATMLRNF